MNQGPTSALQLAIIMSLVGIGPAVILTCTTFARFVIVFAFLKAGLGSVGGPPSQVLIGLSLFMTAFVMAPVGEQIHDAALAPYLAGEIDERVAFEKASPALRRFLTERTRESDLALFYEVSDQGQPDSADDVPLRIAVPAFTVTELRTAFQMGLLLLLPFLVIDLAVATILSALGMVMLPPTVVALPVKLLVFVAVDGWALVVRSLLRGVMA